VYRRVVDKMYRPFRELSCQHHPIVTSAADDDADDTRTSRSAGKRLHDYTVPVPEHSRLRGHSHKNFKSLSIKIYENKGAVYEIRDPRSSKFTGCWGFGTSLSKCSHNFQSRKDKRGAQ
jgi:hypothetical protein